MSAFEVSDRHISALLRAQANLDKYGSLKWEGRALDTGRRELGQALKEANRANLEYLYEGRHTSERATFFYHRNAGAGLELPALLKQIDCYEYQCCDRPEWEGSPEAEFCDSLRRTLIGALPGYDAAPWGI